MILNFSLHIAAKEDKDIFQAFAKVSPLMWETSITIDSPKDNAYEVLLTDNKDEVATVLKNLRANSDIVYLGNVDDIDNYFDCLLDVWPRNENTAVRKSRFRKLVQNLQTKFDAWYAKDDLRTITDSLPDLVWFKDLKGVHMYVNKEFCKTVGKTREDVYGKEHWYIWDIPEEVFKAGPDVCKESEDKVIAAGTTGIFDEQIKIGSQNKQLKTYKTPLYDMFGNVRGTSGMAHDVTDFGNMGLELSILVENLPFPLILCDTNWKTLKMNDSFRKLVSLGNAAIEDFKLQEWMKANMTCIEEGKKEHSNIKTYVTNLNNKETFFNVIKQEVIDYFENVSGYFFIFQDITIARNYEKMILDAANTDALTGLYNRRYFTDFLQNNVSRPMTLLYLDLDHFKDINDNYGHRRGDEILIRTADFMRECFPNSIISRMGGDEFTVLIEHIIPESEAKERCEQLDAKVRTLFRAGGGLHISISYGMSTTDGCCKVEELINEADKRMYKLKKIRHSEA